MQVGAVMFIKKLKNLLNSQRIFTTLISLILIIFLLFNALYYFSAKTFISETSISTNEKLIINSQTFLDSILSNIVSSVSGLSQEKVILDISNPGLNSGAKKYDFNSINKIWETYNTNGEYIKNKYIYYPETDSIYTGSTITPKNFHYMYAYNGEKQMTEEIWLNSVLKKPSSGLISIPSSEETKIFFTYPTYDHINKSLLCNVIVEFNFNKLISDAVGENAEDFFMYSSDGTVISTGLDKNELKEIRKLCNLQNNLQIHHSLNGFDVFKTSSNISSWKYGYIKRNSYVSDTTKQLRINFIVISLISLLIYLFVNIVYINRKKAYGVIDQSNTIENIPYNQKSILKHSLLTNILYGKKNENFSYEEQLSLIGVSMDKEIFVVIVFYASDLSNIFNEDSYSASITEKQDLAHTIMSNIMSESLGQYATSEIVLMGGFCIAIMNIGESQLENFKDEISFIIKSSQDIIYNEFNFKVIAAISEPQFSLSQISKAYNKAIMCMQYAMASSDTILFYEDVSNDSNKTFSAEAKEKIVKCLKEKNFVQCKKEIENLIYNFQLNKIQSTTVTRSFACDLLATFFENLTENSTNTSSYFLAEIEMNNIMSEAATSSEILLKTITIIEKYLQMNSPDGQSDISSDKSGFYIQIKNYIDTNYHDPNLSLGVLASIFKINSSYLSSQFKKEFNIGLIDYITSVRIDTAKKLLLTTNDTNAKIGEKVGYINPRTFLRAFTKYENITPKEYRRINNPSV